MIGTQRKDTVVGASRPAKCRPICHQTSPLFQRITTSVCTLDGVADLMGERCLSDLTRKLRGLAGPIAESAPEPVHGGIDVHPPHHGLHGYRRQRSVPLET